MKKLNKEAVDIAEKIEQERYARRYFDADGNLRGGCMTCREKIAEQRACVWCGRFYWTAEDAPCCVSCEIVPKPDLWRWRVLRVHGGNLASQQREDMTCSGQG